MHALKNIAFVVNTSKQGSVEIANDLTKLATRAGISSSIITDYPLPPDSFAEIDACCAIGGDGTILGTVTEAAHYQVPVLGINLGKLGFMATASADLAVKHFSDFLAGFYRVAHRALLSCKSAKGKTALALNDIVVRNHSAHLVSLEVRCDGELVNRYDCDGIIFASPTGSTAYNLSAGGPIVHPAARVIAMTPICPHTLSNRSLILDQSARLEVILHESDRTVRATMDGREHFHESSAFPLRIQVSEKPLHLVQLCEDSHFRVVRRKLRWGTHNE